MERVSLCGRVEISRLAYGMWRLDEDDTAPARVQAKVEACLEQGITTLDQADIYGAYGAEAFLGDALSAAPHLRDQVEIVTKCDIVAPMGRHAGASVKHYDTSRAHIEASVDMSLKSMGIERIDLLLIHRPDPLMDHHETAATLDDLVAAGKVRAVGVSNFRRHDWTLLQSAMANPLVTNQIEASLGCLEPFTDGQLAFLQERDLHPMIWSPLAGGALLSSPNAALAAELSAQADAQGVDVTAIAVAWLLRHPAGLVPVMGTNRIERIVRFADAFRVDMDREAWFRLYTAARGAEVP